MQRLEIGKFNNMIKARIEKSQGEGLWLIIDSSENEVKKSTIDNMDFLFANSREEDKAGNVAYAILQSELLPIKKAIEDYLKIN